MSHESQHALARYNSLYDNQHYTALAERLAVDLHASRDSVRTSDAMNLITSCALSLVNHPHYTTSWLDLAIFCGQHGVSIATIDAIYAYLLRYQAPDDRRTDDFELTAKALQQALAARPNLQAAISCASGVHDWRGRMAYDLLAAADLLAQAAVQVLMRGSAAYIREKLQAGLQRITGALHEGIRHSEHPEMFDFSETVFPASQDRR